MNSMGFRQIAGPGGLSRIPRDRDFCLPDEGIENSKAISFNLERQLSPKK